MKTRLTVLVLTTFVLSLPCAARAASIMLLPDSSLSASAGETVGWGYDVTADPEWDLEFLGSFMDLPAGSGDLIDLFDFPSVPAGTHVQLAYDPSGPSGLAELTLSPLLSPGDVVAGRIFLDYVRIDPLGARPDEIGVFELQVSAVVSSSSVPEPSLLWLMSLSVAAFAARVQRISGVSSRYRAAESVGADGVNHRYSHALAYAHRR